MAGSSAVGLRLQCRGEGHAIAEWVLYCPRVLLGFSSRTVKYLLDVRPDRSDTVVRIARISQVDEWCTNPVVRVGEKRLAGVTPGQLARQNNPCAIRPAMLRAVL